MTGHVVGALTSCGAHLWVQDPERLSREIGRNVFDRIAIPHAILILSHVADVRDEESIV
jgi:hypothetical protein